MYNLKYKHIKNMEANANPFIKIKLKKIYIYILLLRHFKVHNKYVLVNHK